MTVGQVGSTKACKMLTIFRDNPSASLLAACGGVYFVYYISRIVKKPIIACQDQRLLKFLKNHCPVIAEKYWPTWWCSESRLQTIFRAILQSSPPLAYNSEIIDTPDGGQIKLDWAENTGDHRYDDNLRPTVLILPGLTGCSNEPYILHMVHDAIDLGYRCVVFNNRGNGGAQLLTPRTYCAADTEDLELVVSHIKATRPDAPVMGVGISLGGMILFNYLAKLGKDARLIAGMCVSVAWNVFESTLSLEQPLNCFLFNKRLARLLTDTVKKNVKLFEKHYDMEHVLKSNTIRDFDERFTAKVFGFKSVDDYYKQASLHDKVHALKVPVLCLSAADDPFAPFHTIPLKDAEKNDNIAIVVPSCGGHIGFLEGWFPRHKTYMYRWFAQFVDAVFKHGVKNE
ncbi:phospholipase ABHD3-like [Haliotis rufescens]|uniref:phospholipase ABHD3-like n=1 Tax=Haliotis rufescens TaxID=6454 RepID=UPI001EAFE830|nr:phospholipase ABHD3-like [Haliotis rufescens]